MQNRSGIIRLVVCYAVCFLLLAESFYGYLSYSAAPVLESSVSLFEPQDGFTSSGDTASSESSKTQETQKESNESASSAQSVAADTAAVKGKVLTRYISPYNAPLSYNNVYMKNSTSLNINIKSLLNSNLKYKISKNNEPQVLIMHTHTTESFMSEDNGYYTEDFKSRSTDNSKNMVKIGDIVAKKLNDGGIKALHDTTKHDYPNYTGSYGRSAATVKSYLKKYPSIKVVLDLHRDAVSSGDDKTKLVTEINGKKAAQVMLVMGSQSGSITNHPNWQENLKLALKLQQTLEVKYPTLARPLSLMSKKYNQSLSTGAMLIEFGTDANTLDEACYSAELVGNSLVSLFNTLG